MRAVRLGLLSVALAGVADAQIRASERAHVMQTVDGTTITVDYSRPRARGRDSLFGKQVPFGEVWTPGANRATTLAVSRDVTVDGHPVKAGKYSVWIVMAPGDWELVLDADTTLFHTQGPRARDGQVRFMVHKETRPFVETLTWSFPEVRSTGTQLLLHWATTAVPLDVRVQPTQVLAVDPALGRRVEGRYEIQFVPPPAPPPDSAGAATPPGPPADSSGAAPPPQPPVTTFEIRQRGERLGVVITPPFFEGMGDMVLVRRTDEWFQLAEVDADGLKDVWDELTLEFAFKDGKATGFEVRTKKDEMIARGTLTGR
ncbi:MAG TPA: DUF2911 domain-containing protein [Gemmatimonadales bacterium]|nr:DUF2911 domain-containing protein [Gemmatimonadales bacterium]